MFDEKKIDAIFARLDRGHEPGAAVGIALGGRTLYRKGFGLANLESPVLLTPSTRMRICSTSKHFAALAYLLLCEEGRANLNDPIKTHLPELNPVTHRVTVGQLMGNVSGLRDVHGLCWLFSGMEARVTTADLLGLYRALDDVNFEPGTAYAYNNGGWLILSAIIERIAGQPLEEVLRERIFDPLGMYDTLLRRTDFDFVPRSAMTHMIDVHGRFEKVYVGTPVAGEGGIVSTVDDMMRWMRHMDAPSVGSKATWALITQPQTLKNGTSTGYGFGLSIGSHGDFQTLSHPGGWLGGNAQMLKVPAAGLDIMVLVNRHDVASALLANAVLEACLPKSEPRKPLDPGPIAAGVFHSPATHRVIQLSVQDGQPMAAIDGMAMPVAADASGVLRPIGLMGFMRQSLTVLGEPGRARALRLDDFGNCEDCIACAMPSDAAREPIEGRYESATTGTMLIITQLQGQARMQSIGRFGSVDFGLEPLAEGIWIAQSKTRAGQWSGILTWTLDRSVVRVSSWSNRAVPFQRIA